MVESSIDFSRYIRLRVAWNFQPSPDFPFSTCPLIFAQNSIRSLSLDCYALALLTPHLGCARNFLLIISKMTRQLLLFFVFVFVAQYSARRLSPATISCGVML